MVVSRLPRSLKEFGVHVTTIYCIKYGKTWKHVQLQQDATPASVNV